MSLEVKAPKTHSNASTTFPYETPSAGNVSVDVSVRGNRERVSTISDQYVAARSRSLKELGTYGERQGTHSKQKPDNSRRLHIFRLAYNTIVYLAGRLRSSRLADRLRSDQRHIEYVKKKGKVAWCHIADIGINGTAGDIKHYIKTKGTKCNLNSQDRRGNTILMLAVLSANRTVAKYLLKRSDIDYRIKNKNFKTAIILAIESKDPEITEILCRRGALKDAEDQLLTPLHIAIDPDNYNHECFSLLIRYGADVNKCCWDRGTPLKFAVAQGNRQSAYLLCKLGGTLKQYNDHYPDPKSLFPEFYDSFEKEFSQAILAPLKYGTYLPCEKDQLTAAQKAQWKVMEEILKKSSNETRIEECNKRYSAVVDRLLKIGLVEDSNSINISSRASLTSRSSTCSPAPSFEERNTDGICSEIRPFLTLADLSRFCISF